MSPLSTWAFPSWSCTLTRVQASEPLTHATPGWRLEGGLLSPWVCSSIYNMGRSDQVSGFQVCFVFLFVLFFKHLSPSFKGNFKGKGNWSSECGLPAGPRVPPRQHNVNTGRAGLTLCLSSQRQTALSGRAGRLGRNAERTTELNATNSGERGTAQLGEGRVQEPSQPRAGAPRPGGQAGRPTRGSRPPDRPARGPPP